MLIFNLPLVTKETIRYAEPIAGFCTLLFADQCSVNFPTFSLMLLATRGK